MGSIPIARSIFGCLPLTFVLSEAFAQFFVPMRRCASTSVTRFGILRMKNEALVAGPPTREIQRQCCVFVRQSTKYSDGRAEALALQYY